MQLWRFPGLIKETALEWMDDGAMRLSAALAYYAAFSMAPLLMILISMAGIFLGEEAARGQIATQLQGLAGDRAAEAIQSLVQSTDHKATSLLATLVGLATLLFGASGVFGELKNSLNHIWGVSAKPGRAVRTLIRDRFLSFTMVLSIGFVLLISLVVSAVTAAISTYMQSLMPLPSVIWSGIDLVVSISVVTVLFALIFKILPDVIIRWRDVMVGALVTACLFTIGKIAIGIYLGTSGIGSAYGAAASAIVILLWVYFSSSLLFFGAEFTKVYARACGQDIVPGPSARLEVDAFKEKHGL